MNNQYKPSRRTFLKFSGLATIGAVLLPFLPKFLSPFQSEAKDKLPHIDVLGSYLYIALHTCRPSEDGTQNEHEVDWTDYARQPVRRGNFDIENGVAWNRFAITFGPIGTDMLVAAVSVGDSPNGDGHILWSGPLNGGNRELSKGDTIVFQPGALKIEG